MLFAVCCLYCWSLFIKYCSDDDIGEQVVVVVVVVVIVNVMLFADCIVSLSNYSSYHLFFYNTTVFHFYSDRRQVQRENYLPRRQFVTILNNISFQFEVKKNSRTSRSLSKNEHIGMKRISNLGIQYSFVSKTTCTVLTQTLHLFTYYDYSSNQYCIDFYSVSVVPVFSLSKPRQ